MTSESDSLAAAAGAAGTDDTNLDDRQRLLRAGWIVLRANGYANVGIADILSIAGLGTRAFYRHFRSKDELLVEMFRGNALVTEQHVTALVDAASMAVDQVFAWVDAILDLGYDQRHAEMARMFGSPIFAEAGEAVMEHLRAPLRAALARGYDSGDFSAGDAVNDTATIYAIVWALLLDAISGAPTLDRAAARHHVERFVAPALGGK